MQRCFLSRLHALLCLCLFGVMCNAAAADYEVRIDAPDTLRALLEKNLDIVRWRGNPRIDAEQLQRLVQAAPEQIRTLVATEGFYTPEITSRIDNSKPVWVIDFKVTPGRPTLVGKLDLQLTGFGTTPGSASESKSDQAALKSGWLMQPGVVFRQADWELAKRSLLREVAQSRYPRAELTDTSAVVDPEQARADLKVVLDSGPAVSFGAMRIEGLQRYPDSAVTRLNPIKPGAPYSESALLELQSQLQDSGYFNRVEVSADLDTLDAAGAGNTGPVQVPAQVPVLVHVTENTRKKVGLGIGYSTNTGKRGQLTYDDLNLFGLHWKNGLIVETKKQTARSELFFPITPEGYKDSVGVGFERSDIEGEVTRLASVSAKRAWGRPALERSVSIEYLNEHKSVAGAPLSSSQSLPLTYGVTLRRTDNLLFPTDGYLLNAQFGGAFLPLLTDRMFVRGYAKLVNYHALSKQNILVLRGELGVIGAKGRDGIPEAYLFRAGGDQSVRGYAYQELGVSEASATVGGRYLATASAEYQNWFRPNWGAALFVDAGNAADKPADLKPKFGYGAGARWRSPVGPINLDLAYGQADKQVRLHFSLGFAF
ncbi:autotransporter assembly complex family protein [Undibacterium arcticum]|uniref:Translocation and assembly module subunit TamA n=1 Tax=Undibacterium arcticum TaxID=1762892 RepID=A0ABV7F2Z2_9BURK